MGRRLNDFFAPGFVVVGYYYYYHADCCPLCMMADGSRRNMTYGIVFFDAQESEGHTYMQYSFQ